MNVCEMCVHSDNDGKRCEMYDKCMFYKKSIIHDHPEKQDGSYYDAVTLPIISSISESVMNIEDKESRDAALLAITDGILKSDIEESKKLSTISSFYGFGGLTAIDEFDGFKTEKEDSTKAKPDADCIVDQMTGKHIPTIYLCGKCRARIDRDLKRCWCCGAEIDWDRFFKEFKESEEKDDFRNALKKDGVEYV